MEAALGLADSLSSCPGRAGVWECLEEFEGLLEEAERWLRWAVRAAACASLAELAEEAARALEREEGEARVSGLPGAERLPTSEEVEGRLAALMARWCGGED